MHAAKKRIQLLLGCVGIWLACVNMGQAQIILGWDFDGINASDNPTVNSTTTAAGLNTSAIGYGSGESGVSYMPNAFAIGSGTTYPTLSDAYTGNAYFTFTVTPTANNTVTVNSITGLVFARGSNDGTFTLESSIGGFGSSAGNILAAQTVATGTSDSGNPTTLTLTLSSPLVFSTATEFRIYDSGIQVYNESGFGSTRGGVGDGLDINGSVSAPEPSTWTMMMLGGLGFLIYFQRRGRRA